MNFPIQINAVTTDNTKLGTVLLIHAPEDAKKIIAIRTSLLKGETFRRPVILMDAGDHHIAFSGMHRLAAAQGIDDTIVAVYLPEDLTQEQWDLIETSSDDDDRLAAFVEIASERDDMDEVVAAMRAEVESNNA